MKLTFSLDALKNGAKIVKGATGKGSSDFALLEGLMIEVDAEQKVKLRATDRAIGIVCSIPAEVDAEGTALGGSDSSFVLPREFFSLIDRLKGAQVEMTCDSEANSVQLVCGGNRFKLNTSVATNYPVFSEPAGDWMYEIDQGAFKAALKRVAVAMETNPNGRPIFQGVLFDVASDMSLSATNSYQLTREVVMKGVDWMQQSNAVIPAGTVKLLNNLLGDNNDHQIKIRIEDAVIFFEIGGESGITISSVRVHGNFPSITGVIPTSTNFSVTVERKDLIDGLAMLKPLAESFMVRFDGDTENNLLYITGRKGSAGSGVVKVPIENHTGTSLGICSDGKFLNDSLKSLAADKIRLSFTRQDGPCTVQMQGNEDYVYVFMPVRAAIEPPEELDIEDTATVTEDIIDYDNDTDTAEVA